MSNEYRDWLRDECDELQARIAELEAENALIHEEMDTKNMASSRALDELWGIIILNKKPDYGDWEYPMMAMRHIVIEFEKLQARIAELEGALEEKIYPKCNCDKCTGSGIDALYD